MLVDITPIPNNDPIYAMISGGRSNAVRLDQGMYQMWHWGAKHCFVERLAEHFDLTRNMSWEDISAQGQAERERLESKYGEDYPYFSEYGVCDNLAQVVERWPHLAEDHLPYVICGVEIRREEQPASGGWRYHKWGEYIGTQDPQSEYIYDDTHIDAVWTYHVYRVLL